MRIGIVAPPWVPVPPPAYGGTEAIIDRLARGLQAAGQEILLWTTGDSTCPVPRRSVLPRAEGDRIGIAAIELRHLVRGYEAMVDWGAEIVHDHTIIGPVYARRFADLPVVTTNHGPFNEELTDLYRAIADDVPIIAISHGQAASAGRLPIAAVIHHGIDLDRFPMGTGAGDERGPYFLFLGRMAAEKGPRRAALAAKRSGARLLMAAKMREPWEHQYFEEQVRPLLDGDIEYVGEVDHDTKVRLLRDATALVNPIRWPEPFGLVMIEALSCGTPVLAFGEGSAPEIVDHGETGYLCSDVDDLARHFAKAPGLDRARCRQVAQSRFSTDRMVAEHLRLFREIVDDGAGR